MKQNEVESKDNIEIDADELYAEGNINPDLEVNQRLIGRFSSQFFKRNEYSKLIIKFSITIPQITNSFLKF